MYRKLAFLVLAIWFAAVGGTSSAQAVCTTSSTIAQVRAEGTAEVLGPLALSCTGLPASSIALTLAMGAAVVPTSPTPDNKTTFPLPTIASTVAFTAGPAVSVTANTVLFSFTPAAGAQTIVISGIRVNIPASALPLGSPITAALATSVADVSFTSASAVLGIVTSGLGNGSGFPNNPLNIVACSPAIVAPAGLPSTVPGNPDPSAVAANSLQVSFVEGYAGAFLTAAHEDGALGGLQGTRLLIRLTGVPSGIVPYAPRVVAGASAASTGAISPPGSPLVIQRVDGTNADGSGGVVLSAVMDQFDQVAVTGGTATIVYEVTSDSPSTTDTASLFVALAAADALVSGNIGGTVSLAPLGPPTAAPARPQFAPSTAIGLGASAITLRTFINTNPAAQTLAITNLGSGLLDWSARPVSITGGDWLTLVDASSVNSGAVTVAASSSSLPIGIYNAAIEISSPDAINSPQSVPVTLWVTDHPTLFPTPTSLQFSAALGSGTISQQLLINSNVEAAAFSAAVSTSTGGSWLSISPNSGMTALFASVTVNPAGLAPGTYQGTITLSGPDVTGPQTVAVTLMVGTPGIVFTPSSLLFTTSQGVNPAAQTFQIQNSGSGVLGWSASASTASGADWLSVSPNSSVAPTSVQAIVHAAALPAGVYQGSITISSVPSPSANGPQVLPVVLTVDAPVVSSVSNAASFAGGAVSPGLIAALMGTGLSLQTATAPAGAALPITLGGTQVLVNGSPAPLFYVSPGQINFQVPAETTGAQAQVMVVSNGIPGLAVTVNLTASTPGIFTAPSTDAVLRGAVVDNNAMLNSSANPAAAGSGIQVYATGLGNVAPPVPSGQPPAIAPLSQSVVTPTVLIGGVPAAVSFSGLAPGFVGLYQLNVTIPPALQPSTAVPVQIQMGSASSNIVYIVVD